MATSYEKWYEQWIIIDDGKVLNKIWVKKENLPVIFIDCFDYLNQPLSLESYHLCNKYFYNFFYNLDMKNLK